MSAMKTVCGFLLWHLLLSSLAKFFKCPEAMPRGCQPLHPHPRVSGIRGHVKTSESVCAPLISKLSWQRQCVTWNRWRPYVFALYLYLSVHVCHNIYPYLRLLPWKWIECTHTFIYITTQLLKVTAPIPAKLLAWNMSRKGLKFPYWQRMEGWVSLNSFYL